MSIALEDSAGDMPAQSTKDPSDPEADSPKKKKKSKKPQGADAFLNDSLESSFKDSTLKSMEEDQKRRQENQFFTDDDEEEEEEDHVKRMKELL